MEVLLPGVVVGLVQTHSQFSAGSGVSPSMDTGFPAPSRDRVPHGSPSPLP